MKQLHRFYSGTIAAATAACALTTGALWLAAPDARADVTVSPSDTAARADSVLTVAFTQGCNGSPTTKLTVSIPSSISVVYPGVSPGWDTTTVTEPLNPPASPGAEAISSTRITQIIYTAQNPIPDGYRAAATFEVVLPDDPAGTAVAFPTLQSCESGEVNWGQLPGVAAGSTPAAGQANDVSAPAPTITLTDATSAAGITQQEQEHEAMAGEIEALSVWGITFGLLGLLLAAIAFIVAIVAVRARRHG